jgi:hypothetical protein
MTIDREPEALSLLLKKEIGATAVILGRMVQRNPETGAIEVVFPVTINFGFVTYELDADGNKTGIYESGDMGSFQLEPAELYALWMTPVTLSDGTQTVLAEVISTSTDNAIRVRVDGAPVEDAP